MQNKNDAISFTCFNIKTQKFWCNNRTNGAIQQICLQSKTALEIFLYILFKSELTSVTEISFDK